MQCMQDRKNVGKVLLSPLKEPPSPEPKEQPKKAKEPEKQEEKEGEKVSRDREMKELRGKVSLPFFYRIHLDSLTKNPLILI